MRKVYRNDDWIREQYIKEGIKNKRSLESLNDSINEQEKESKRVKIKSQFATEGELLEFEKNVDKAFDAHLKFEEERKRKQKELNDIESQRVADLSCPSCKSKEKQLHQHTTNNGIIGSGFKRTIHNEYYICLGCGIHYTDVYKLKNK